MTTPWTVARLLNWTREHLAQKGIASPRLCAEILLASAMGCQRIHLYTRFQETPGENVLSRFRADVKRAAQGHPVAHLTGQKEFFSLPLEVSPDVLIPRPETEVLVERAIALVRKAPHQDPAILDLGTGSGCIALALARHLPAARIFASDISDAALAVARRNAAHHGLTDRINFRAGDLLEPWQSPPADANAQRFDIIVSNPPYVADNDPHVAPDVRQYEPHLALFAGPDGLDIIRRLVSVAPQHLHPDGSLLMEIGYNQATAVRELFDDHWTDLVTYRDGAGHERVIHARHAATE